MGSTVEILAKRPCLYLLAGDGAGNNWSGSILYGTRRQKLQMVNRREEVTCDTIYYYCYLE